MALSRFGRWALGLYPPSVPDDLRLTDIRPVGDGQSMIVPAVEIGEQDRLRLRAYQEQQHAVRDQIQESLASRELREREG